MNRPDRWIIAACLAAIVGLAIAFALTDKAGAYPGDCRTHGCRPHRERVRDRWQRVVRASGLASTLDARAWCESRGRYGLSTTGNGYWFAFQFDPQAWVGSGGFTRRVDVGYPRPVGRWRTQPKKLEQRYRAVVWGRVHGGDAWPSCP